MVFLQKVIKVYLGIGCGTRGRRFCSVAGKLSRARVIVLDEMLIGHCGGHCSGFGDANRGIAHIRDSGCCYKDINTKLPFALGTNDQPYVSLTFFYGYGRAIGPGWVGMVCRPTGRHLGQHFATAFEAQALQARPMAFPNTFAVVHWHGAWGVTRIDRRLTRAWKRWDAGQPSTGPVGIRWAWTVTR